MDMGCCPSSPSSTILRSAYMTLNTRLATLIKYIYIYIYIYINLLDDGVPLVLGPWVAAHTSPYVNPALALVALLNKTKLSRDSTINYYIFYYLAQNASTLIF